MSKSRLLMSRMGSDGESFVCCGGVASYAGPCALAVL
jgi:hypothetical protein